MDRRPRRPVLVAIALAVTLLTGCTVEIAGQARPEGALDSTTVDGLPITDGPSGPKPGARDAELQVVNLAGGEMDRLAVNSLADIFHYWSERLPADFGVDFAPPAKLVSFDSTGPSIPVCGGKIGTRGLVNAQYCNNDDSIGWDRGKLLPFINKQFGPMSVFGVLAHEVGHAIQFRLGERTGVTRETPSIVLEQQADCYMGAVVRWVAEGKAPHFRISTGPGIDKIMSTMVAIKDKVGEVATDRQAHGSAFDRVFAFQAGFSDGPKRCAKIDMAEIETRITERAFDRAEVSTRGNIKVDDRSLDQLSASLKAALPDVGDEPPAIDPAGDGNCPEGKSTPPASYCPTVNKISIDTDRLNEIAQPPDEESGILGGGGSDGQGIGDFAAFGEVASRYALAVQRKQGKPLDDSKTGLRTACLVGTWAGFTRPGNPNHGPLALSPGDLDEAVIEMLGERSMIAADINGRTVRSGFARVEAFRIGYLEGTQACTIKIDN